MVSGREACERVSTSRGVLSSATAGARRGEALRRADEQDGGDDGDDGPEDVELEQISGAEEVGDDTADHRTGQAEQQGSPPGSGAAMAAPLQFLDVYPASAENDARPIVVIRGEAAMTTP